MIKGGAKKALPVSGGKPWWWDLVPINQISPDGHPNMEDVGDWLEVSSLLLGKIP